MSEPLSMRASYAGKHVLLTGASGFVGKVWLALMLERVPEVGRIYVLLRRKSLLSARERFEKIVNGSPAFQPLHAKYGAGFSAFLADKVEVMEGEITEPEVGLSHADRVKLQRNLDLVVHCAGLVDFDPDLRKALAANVDGTMRVADLTRSCDHAALLHISTCYVAGKRYGHIAEEIVPDYAPYAPPGFDPERELNDARMAAEHVCGQHDAPEHLAAVRAEAESRVNGSTAAEHSRRAVGETRRLLRERLRQALSDEGMARARKLGWPNTYTYSKSLAESLLLRRQDGLRFSVLRPSIVESAVEYPFAGWNESFNGSAPLAYVMSSWFRAIPARPTGAFDVIPVDMVAKAMTIAGAALIEGRAARVYHVGSSYKHRISVGRAAELIVLAHRKYYRDPARTRSERLFKARFDAVLVEPDDAFSIQHQRGVAQTAVEAIDLLPDKWIKKLKRFRNRIVDADDRMASIEKLIGLYLPFMYEGHYVFESRTIDATPALEPELRFEPERLDWRTYWLDIHIPGLRRWAFPLIEGKKPERYKPEHPVRISERPVAHPEHASHFSATQR